MESEESEGLVVRSDLTSIVKKYISEHRDGIEVDSLIKNVGKEYPNASPQEIREAYLFLTLSASQNDER